MAKILNIDTSSAHCSVALAIDGEVTAGFESSEKMDHSVSLAPFVEKCLENLRSRGEKPDAVSVTMGPGSYTGLRIGLSLAKGLAFGYDIPLIGLSSLEVMAVRAFFTYADFSGDELVVPMIDARRMEVYTAVFDSSLNKIKEETPLILEPDSMKDLDEGRKLLFIGDGSTKFKPVCNNGNAVWLGEGMAHVKYMAALSEKYYKEKKFADVAYSVPQYLKEYMTTKPKNRL